jgi:hypothetical protein
MKKEDVARILYDANKSYCETLGDRSFTSWDEAPDWQKETIRKGIEFHLANPNAGPAASHASWLEEKRLAGWKYGPVKDAERKEHPCYVPYDHLPIDQQAKDYLFSGIVHSLKRFITDYNYRRKPMIDEKK